ncbi:MAG: hypothetical protein IJ781_03505 [Atopobiaceae bacterium]|nr:hypothetical protein [Atopobiaceae bacterium]
MPIFGMLCMGMWGGGFTMLFFNMECAGRGGLLGLVFTFFFNIKIFAVGTVGMSVLGCLATYLYIVRARGGC